GESAAASGAHDVAEEPGALLEERSSPEGSSETGILEEDAMELNCKHVWAYISDYIDDSVAPELRADIERHLEHCEICSAILDSTRNILILTADDCTFELPVGFSERLHERLARELAANREGENGFSF